MKFYSVLLILCVLEFNCVFAQNDLYPKNHAWKELSVNNWTGVIKNGEELVLKVPGKAVYTIPDGIKGWYQRGLMTENDGVVDIRNLYGIRFELFLENDDLLDARLTIARPFKNGRHDLPDSTSAILKAQGKGWHTIIIPFTSFDYYRGQFQFLKFVKQISINANSVKNSRVAFRNVKLIQGNPLYFDAVVRSKPADADSTIKYTATLGNSSEVVQYVNLAICKKGWEGMKTRIEPSFVFLKPGEEKEITVFVTVPSIVPQGSQETQTLDAFLANGVSTQIDFITVCRLAGSYIVLNEAGWQDVLNKTKKYDWAKKELDETIKKADEFIVPEVPSDNLPGEESRAVLKSYIEQRFWPVAVAYKLTGDKRYAEKIAFLLCRLSAPGAYPKTLHANSQGIPQEGGLFEGVARSYDLIRDAGVLSKEDKAQIEQSMRLYIYTLLDGMGNGGISNWSLFNLCPGAQCALAIQDMQLFNELMDGKGGVRDHVRYGTMDDGWWYEVSLSYNIGCVENLTSLGIAAKPFGIDFLNEKIKASLSQNVGLRPFEYENFLGMAFGKFGPIKRNVVTIKDMWDAITVYPDYRGVMFGMGDGHEQKVGAGPFEMAYFAFRDTAYAAILKQADKRDLIYGVPELPAKTPILYAKSGHSDNAGVAVLRSQTEGREQREQIQAALKYGTHGSYHGHFDRASLLSLMRYGRSFWNPECSWFGYGSYMYKWWVQTSMVSNMVVVDGKMQEPRESNPLVYYSGKMMQVMAVETNARWSNPPYMGGYDQVDKVKNGSAGYVPVPENHPVFTEVTDYTEPVLQRRLMIVTDDYVVIADYLKGTKEHTFDNLLHLRGAMAGDGLKFTGHDAQFDVSPLSTGQFITSVDNYNSTKGAKIPSKMIVDPVGGWETGGFNGFQETGNLNINVYHAWPLKAEVRIGNYAEGVNVGKKLNYEVVADGKCMVTDSLGTWILGNRAVNVSIKDAETLQLRVKTNRGASTKNTLFWANAKIVTSNGKEISLNNLKTVVTNVIPTPEKGKDYKGGPVKIAGTAYTDVLATEPENTKEYAVITINLTGLDAKTFRANIGGDYPVGNEDQVRKTVSYRTSGKEAQFLSVLEPFETKSMVKSVRATDAGTLEVELNDGRNQQIKIKGLNSADVKITVEIQELKDKKIVREEKIK